MTQAPTARSGPLCRHPQCEGYAEGCRVADLAWSERSRLLAVARRRAASPAEAEDVVSEAMTRALECPDVDPERAAAWLTAVTIRLCSDHVRDRARAPKRWLYAVRTYRSDEFEDDVVDTLSAAEIAPLLNDMPTQQRRALQLRADGAPVAAIAAEMELTEKAVESLLGRARNAARTIVAGLGSVGALCFGWARRPASNSAPVALSTAMACAVTTIAAAHFAVPRQAAHAPAVVPARPAAPPAAPAPSRTFALGSPAHVRALDTPASATTRATPRERVVVAHRDVKAGPAKVHYGGSGRVDPDKSFVDSVRACIAGGVEVSTTYVGCRSGKPDRMPLHTSAEP